MRRIVVASQMTDDFNSAFLKAVDDVELIQWPRGVPKDLPPEVEVLLGIPFDRHGADLSYPPPLGWPYGLKWIQLISAGVDMYPAWLFTGIPVSSARGATAVALAEFALGAIFASAKRFPEIWIHDPKDWKFSGLGLVEGATVGLVGFGAISECLATKAMALGMKVLTVRRTNKPLPPGVERAADLKDLFSRSDHVVLACAATPETEGMVSADLLAHAKKGLHLINMARGQIIDDAALIAALDAGQVRLATLDCAHPEPPPAGHPFYTHKRVRLSAHTSSWVPNFTQNLVDKFIDNFQRYRAGQPVTDVVDPKLGY